LDEPGLWTSGGTAVPSFNVTAIIIIVVIIVVIIIIDIIGNVLSPILALKYEIRGYVLKNLCKFSQKITSSGNNFQDVSSRQNSLFVDSKYSREFKPLIKVGHIVSVQGLTCTPMLMLGGAFKGYSPE
jgi:hypothetical protein